MELQSLCCNFDLEDKLSLSQLKPTQNIPIALCVIDPRPTAIYQPPKSTSTQALICRFMQEALHAQFHLLMLSQQPLDEFNLTKCLKLAEQQLEFFLQKHQWQAYIHAIILIPRLETTLSLKIVYIGNPTFFSLTAPTNNTDYHSSPKALKKGFGMSYPFNIEIQELPIQKSERFITGFLAWQPLRASRVQDLIHSRWEALPDLILEMIHHQELSGSPFFLIQITPEKSAWIEGLKMLLRSSFHKARRLAGIS